MISASPRRFLTRWAALPVAPEIVDDVVLWMSAVQTLHMLTSLLVKRLYSEFLSFSKWGFVLRIISWWAPKNMCTQHSHTQSKIRRNIIISRVLLPIRIRNSTISPHYPKPFFSLCFPLVATCHKFQWFDFCSQSVYGFLGKCERDKKNCYPSTKRIRQLGALLQLVIFLDQVKPSHGKVFFDNWNLGLHSNFNGFAHREIQILIACYLKFHQIIKLFIPTTAESRKRKFSERGEAFYTPDCPKLG